jgi:hypothetical protein
LQVDGFWMDETDATNAEFEKFAGFRIARGLAMNALAKSGPQHGLKVAEVIVTL